MSYSLQDIERAVRANFITVSDGKKFLEVAMGEHRHQRNAGRMVFIGIAYGDHSYDEITAYTGMSLYDCLSLTRNFRHYYDRGKQKCKDPTVPFDDPDIRIFRKTTLVRNYLTSLVRATIVK